MVKQLYGGAYLLYTWDHHGPLSLTLIVEMQMLKFSETTTVGKGHVLNMDNFIDTTNIEGRFELSEWVRAYGKYLDEQLEVYQKINFYQVWLQRLCNTAAACFLPNTGADAHICSTAKQASFDCDTSSNNGLDHHISCSVMLQQSVVQQPPWDTLSMIVC